MGSIAMVANTGTYIDAPFHRYADGRDLSQFDLASVANLEGETEWNAEAEASFREFALKRLPASRAHASLHCRAKEHAFSADWWR